MYYDSITNRNYGGYFCIAVLTVGLIVLACFAFEGLKGGRQDFRLFVEGNEYAKGSPEYKSAKRDLNWLYAFVSVASFAVLSLFIIIVWWISSTVLIITDGPKSIEAHYDVSHATLDTRNSMPEVYKMYTKDGKLISCLFDEQGGAHKFRLSNCTDGYGNPTAIPSAK